ncbi:MAG TPA: hypothetical protein VIC51_13805 [Psychromonas sp.]
MSWIGNLFGTESAVNNLVDKDDGLIVRAGSAIGNLHYSNQERANDDKENAKALQEWSIRFLDAMAPFKIVQRVLAFAAMFFWLFVGLNVVIAIWIKAIYPEIDAVTALTEFAFSDYVFYPVMAIFVLYTGGGTINSIRGTK